MSFLLDEKCLERTPVAVAEFLRSTIGLDKTQIGEFLGDRDPFHQSVLACYLNTFSFVCLDIDEALRLFLSSFRLPGEAQKIDRLMERFAEKYFADSPNGFADQDSVYILAFSIIMLATDLWNPSVKNKMTKSEWLKNNRGNNGGKDYDKNFLLILYDRIASEQLKVGDDHDPSLSEEEGTFAEQRQLKLEQQEQDRHFQRRFHLETDEIIIREYLCTCKRSGRLFISNRHVCFYSKLFGIKEKKILAFCHIIQITKEKTNEFVIVEKLKRTHSVSFTFTTSKDLDEAYSLLLNIWENNKNSALLSGDVQSGSASSKLRTPQEMDRTKNKSKISLINDLPTEEDWNLLLKRAKQLSFTKDTVIVHRNEISHRIYQVVKGCVRIELNSVAQTEESPPNISVNNESNHMTCNINTDSLPKESTKVRVHELFSNFDKDMDDLLKFEEFASMASSVLEIPLSDSFLNEMFKRVNYNCDGHICFEEFYDWWCNVREMDARKTSNTLVPVKSIYNDQDDSSLSKENTTVLSKTDANAANGEHRKNSVTDSPIPNNEQDSIANTLNRLLRRLKKKYFQSFIKTLSFSNGNAGGRLLSTSSSDLRNSGEVMNETATVTKNVNLDGKLASSVNSHTNSMSIVRIGEGEIFGELSFLEGSTSSVMILADSNVVELLVMEGHMLIQLFEWKPELAARFFKVLFSFLERKSCFSNIVHYSLTTVSGYGD